MARKISELTDKEARGNLKPGYHSDRLTTGLWLAVGKPTKTGKVSKSWVFRYVPPVEAGTVAVRGAGNTADRKSVV